MNQFRAAYHYIRSFPSAFWVVIAATLINQIGNMVFVFLVVYANKHLGFTISQASITFAVFGISMFLTGLLGGSIIDRLGAARILVAVLIGNGVTLLIIPLAHSFYTVTLLCAIWGFFYGFYRPASQTMVSLLSTAGMHKITFSVYRLVINLGMSIGPALGGYLAMYSFNSIFIVNGVANLIASMILFIGLDTVWLQKRPATTSKLEWGFTWLKQDNILRLFVLAMVPVSMIFFQHDSTLPIFINRDLNLPLSFYGFLFTINTLLIVLFELPLNIATMNWSYRTNFMLGSFFITAGFAGMYFVSTELHIILLTAFWTVGEMMLYPAANSYIADIAPEEHRGSYMSLYNTTFNLGLVLGPWCGAQIMEAFNVHTLWLACGWWGMLSVLLFYFVRTNTTATKTAQETA